MRRKRKSHKVKLSGKIIQEDMSGYGTQMVTLIDDYGEDYLIETTGLMRNSEDWIDKHVEVIGVIARREGVNHLRVIRMWEVTEFADVDFESGSLTLDLSGGGSCQINFSNIDSVVLGDHVATVLDGDLTADDFTGEGVYINGGNVFEVDVDGNGNVDFSYDATTHTLSISDNDVLPTCEAEALEAQLRSHGWTGECSISGNCDSCTCE